MTSSDGKRRSLLLAGGGLKVAFQAGVLQVWLDEAGIEFDHVDACSGGAFNLAMYLQGSSGTQIADAWRRTDPRDGVSTRMADLLSFPFGRSLIDLDKYRKYVFRRWGLDEKLIRASTRAKATFNAYDITRRRLRVFSAAEFSFDVLCACVSLPTWFPPVPLEDGLYTDAVFVTDANVDAALEDGADEILDHLDGQPAPRMAPGRHQPVLPRPRDSGERPPPAGPRPDRGEQQGLQGRRGGPARPLHQGAPAVCRGTRAVPDRARRRPPPPRRRARRRRGPRLVRPARRALHTWTSCVRYDDGVTLEFHDGLHGRLTRASDDAQERRHGVAVDADLQLVVDDAGLFATDPSHRLRLRGHVVSDLFGGGSAEVLDGTAHILVADKGDPTRRKMTYRALLRDDRGQRFTLLGEKRVDSGRLGRLWSETTTLRTRIVAGHVDADDDRGDHELVAAGTLRMGVRDVLGQLFTTRVHGPRLWPKARGLTRYGAAFAGNLWDVYGRRFISYGPF